MKTNRGFTLIESLISLLLLSIILAGGLSFYFNSDEIMSLAMHKKIAMEMANQSMEKIKKDGYANLLPPTIGFVSGPFGSAMTFGDFTAQTQQRVTHVEGISPNINKMIEVKVSWTEAGKQTSREILLATYMAP